MKKSRAAMLVTGALVLGLTLGGLGTATARTSTTSSTRASMPQTTTGTSSPVVTLANMTGLSIQEINALRADGKSLATIATESGIDPAAVVAQTIAARKNYLDSLVAAGKMTAAQEETILATITARVTAMMNAVPSVQTVAPKPSPSKKRATHDATQRRNSPRHSSQTGRTTSTRSSNRTYSGTTSTRDNWDDNHSGDVRHSAQQGDCGW